MLYLLTTYPPAPCHWLSFNWQRYTKVPYPSRSMLRAPRAPYEIPTLLSQMVPKKIAENGTWKLFHWKGQISSCSQLPVGCISYLKLETMTTVRFYPRRMVHNEVVCHGSIAAASSSSPQHDQTKMIWLFQVAEISNSMVYVRLSWYYFKYPEIFKLENILSQKISPLLLFAAAQLVRAFRTSPKVPLPASPERLKGFPC